MCTYLFFSSSAFQITSPFLFSTLLIHSIRTNFSSSPSVRITSFALLHHLRPAARLRFTSTQIKMFEEARIPDMTVGAEASATGSDTVADDDDGDGDAPPGARKAKCTCCLPIGRKPPVLRISFQLAASVPWTT